jgi:glycosyltransferase involved in cell wall biosynthesis
MKSLGISVVTVTQTKRIPILKMVALCISRQSMRPDEWVIVDGNSTPEDGALLEKEMKNLREISNVPIVYAPYHPGLALGAMRNRGNAICRGEIIVCMDDDDYYPPTRIEHVLEKFKEFPTKKIAGCTSMFIHDYNELQFYQCAGYHENHSTNSAFAYRKSYLQQHRYEDTKKTGEEASFTNQFTEPLIQLDPLHTIVLSSHQTNTFDKKDLLKNNPKFVPIAFKLAPKILDIMVYRKFLKTFREMESKNE